MEQDKKDMWQKTQRYRCLIKSEYEPIDEEKYDD